MFSNLSIHRSIEYNNGEIFFKILGQGKKIMLLHGFGEDGNIWNALIEEINKKSPNKFQFIVPDLPGSGSSTNINNHTIEEMAEAMMQVVKATAVNSEKIILIGHSMGGYIALEMIEKYSQYFIAFGLFHSFALADNVEKINARKQAIQFINTYGSKKFLQTSIPQLFCEETKKINPSLISDFLDQQNNFNAHALTQYYYAMMERQDKCLVLQTTNLPVLFILGETDSIIPLKIGIKQALLPQISYINIVTKSGHMGMLEEINNCANILIHFFNANFTIL